MFYNFFINKNSFVKKASITHYKKLKIEKKILIKISFLYDFLIKISIVKKYFTSYKKIKKKKKILIKFIFLWLFKKKL